MKIGGRSIRSLVWLAGVIAAFAGWSTLLWPPVRFFYARPGVGFWSTFGELISPTNSIYPDGPFLGWMFLLSSLLLIFTVPLAAIRVLSALLRYVEISEADISLLNTSITLRMSDDLAKTTVVRDQLFHANQPGITAYHYKQTVHNPHGRILSSSFEMETAVNNVKLTKEFSETFTNQKFEAIEIFDRSLPTSLLATYLPDWLVEFLFERTSLVDKAVVRRNGQIIMENEHNGAEGIYQISSSRTSKNVTVTLDFPAERAPRSNDIKCFIIKGNIVSEMRPRSCTAANRRMYVTELGVLERGASLRLQWTNRTAEPNPGEPPITNIVGKQPNLWRRILTRRVTAQPTVTTTVDASG